jgi:hypothetical protein
MPKPQPAPQKTNKMTLKPKFDKVLVDGSVFVAIEVSQITLQPFKDRESYPDYFKR